MDQDQRLSKLETSFAVLEHKVEDAKNLHKEKIGEVKDDLNNLGKKVEIQGSTQDSVNRQVELALLKNNQSLEAILKKLENLPDSAEKSVELLKKIDALIATKKSGFAHLKNPQVYVPAGTLGGILLLLSTITGGRSPEMMPAAPPKAPSVNRGIPAR